MMKNKGRQLNGSLSNISTPKLSEHTFVAGGPIASRVSGHCLTVALKQLFFFKKKNKQQAAIF